MWTEEIQCRGTESQIYSCPTAPSQTQSCSHRNDVGLKCSDVRLADGNNPCAGRVEVYRNRQWGTVCDSGWDEVDAGVVCRQLGCENVAVYRTYSFGPGSGRIWMPYVNCTGSESTLNDCERGFGAMACDHSNDVGVVCSAHRSVRLVDGAGLCSGRVEVDHGNLMGTVCDADFDQQDAEVVCRELKCGVPKEWGAAVFGQGEGQMWTEEIQCRGNESQIYSCPTAPSQYQSCSHRNDVGLKCSVYTESRLADGPDRCSGRVELQYLGTWGQVCGACWDSRTSNVLCRQLKYLFLVALNGTVRLARGSECMGQVEVYYQGNWSRVVGTWSSSEASVACRQLGCGSVVQVNRSSPPESGGSDVCVSGIQCSGEEPHLGNCSAPHKLTCGSEEQVTIVCSNSGHRSLRLVGGGGDCAGRLEVFHRGSWGTVCDDSWDLADAQVVCRQLQCGTALRAPVPSFFGPGKGHVWLEEVGCVGNETSLWDCPMAEWDRGYCGHKRDVGVVCSEFKEMRLTEGCSGNLEVLYNGTWGNVCFSGMDRETASLICQELNCGKSSHVEQKERRLKSAPNWLDHFNCRPHDSSLWHCTSSSWGQNQCDTQDVASLNCSAEEDKDVQRSKLSCSSEENRRPCTNHWPLRLVGGEEGCSGRLEVFLNGSWNMVCGDSWGMEEAQVVCRQVGCGSAVAALSIASAGTGSSKAWLTEVKCRGSELHLWDCQYSEPQHNGCPQRNPAGVNCTGISTVTTKATSPPGDLQTEETPENYDDVITPDKPAKSMAGDQVTDTENYDDAVTVDWIQMGGKGLTTENPPTFSGRDYDDVGEGLPERGGEY
ncbi:hypothetical protein GJAV_G00146340 [Gymnothorax javanicus]|nr:hypothetical protein GJAV_G00146340 [Gymnothorax javanicus]